MPATGARVELDLGGTWTDITDRVYLRDRIRITRGRHDQGSRADPGSLSLTLNNKQGYFSPRNPLSPLYGQIGRNTPVRVSAVGGDPWLNLDGTTTAPASTPAVPALQITGDLDVRAEVEMDWRDPDTAQGIAGRWTPGGDIWLLWVYQGTVRFTWWDSGGFHWFVTGAIPDGMPAHAAVRATLDVDNGSGGATATLYWSDSISGTWTQINAATATGTQTLPTNSTPLAVAPPDGTGVVPATGRLYALEVRDGIGGTLVADADFTAQTPGVTAFTDGAGLDWTVTAGTLSNRHVRFVGEVSAWPTRWDVSGGDVYVPVQAAGIMRRLSQGASPLDSTLRRRIPSADHLLGYWPLEDGQDATTAASGLPGGRAATATGLAWASESSLGGSAPLPVVGSAVGRLAAPVPAATGSGWHVECVYKLPTLPSSTTEILRVQVGGAILRRAVVSASSSAIRVEGFDSDGTSLGFFSFTDIDAVREFGGQWNRLVITVSDDVSGKCRLFAAWPSISTNRWWQANTQFTSGLGHVQSVSGAWSSSLSGLSVGHIAVFDVHATWDGTDPTFGTTIFDGADSGFDGDTTYQRVSRLCAEEDVPLLLPYGIATAGAMGPQRPGTLLALLEDAAEADVGVLYEARERIALAYRPRVTLYNQAPTLALDYTARGEVAPPLEPTEDDTATVNDVTVSRPSGSSTRVTLDTGPLSTQAPPDGVGRYATSLTRNVQSDDQLPDLAAWLLHLGTVDEPRYPAITVNLAAGPWLRGDACATDIGDVITITGLPVWLPPGDLTAMVQGYTETLGVYDWTITYNCTPASPWTVGVLGSTTRVPRAGTSGCTLGADVDADDTTLSLVTATGSARWIDSATYGDEFPFDLLLGGGERVTCTAITGTGLTQSATVTRAVNGIARGWDTGTAVVLADPTYTAL